jgi:hypothetical protein
VNQRNLTRALAIICIVAALPLAFLTLPWLPGTILDYADLLRAPVPAWATESYRTSRESHLHHSEVALTLYALGLLALAGLAAITAKILPVSAELLLWLITAGTAVGISSFWGPSISSGTDPTFILFAVRVPVGIAAVAGLGAVVSLAQIRVRLSQSQ